MKIDNRVIIGKYKSQDVINESSSGGAFTVLYEYAIINGYVVYGVKFDEDFKVIHSRATTIEECEGFRKSKYVFSDMKNIYQQVERDLRDERFVLFTGTPCQCVAIKNFLSLKHVDTSRLLVVDLICHGAPNQIIFDKYRLENQKNMNEEWVNYRFKSKYSNQGVVNSRSAEIYYKSNNFMYQTIENDPFLRGYYSRLFYRKSCAECPFATPNRVGDITIGDAWGVEKIRPEWDSIKGISLILINSEKGSTLVSEFYKKMELIESNVEWAVNNNSQLSKPTEMHKNRDLFFESLSKLGFQKAIEKALKIPLWRRCARTVKVVLRGYKIWKK